MTKQTKVGLVVLVLFVGAYAFKTLEVKTITKPIRKLANTINNSLDSLIN